MRLYEAEFVRPDGIVNGHIVAPSGATATQFAKEYHDETGIHVSQITIARIDDKLPSRRRWGLDDLLETASIGFASECPPLGWFGHTLVQPRLKLYRIEPENEEAVHIIAQNPDVASAIWLCGLDLGDDGAHPFWSISQGLDHLDEQQRAEMENRLEVGPVGEYVWNSERGWALK
ncbi:hypothetical protein [Altererythrobacter sp. C41]|uniref:hypothetical protein n=1 Tax=Altererythrobacter sp. C41 TaxID=2806021 RepID=UPI001EE3B11B|nr:hypothetical protein [Altererythrobacter sp. C41]